MKVTIENVRRCYDLNGFALMVEGDQAQIRFLDPILGLLAAPDRIPRDWLVTLLAASEVEAPPVASHMIWEGALPEGLQSVFCEHERKRTLFVANHFSMTIDAGSRSSLVRFTPEGASSMRGTAAFWLLGEILAVKDRFLLHGACLVEPRSDQAFALFAPSGTGKTTTALALARNGLVLAGDDALVLEIAQDNAYLWSVPRGLKVHRLTADFLPWLGPALKEWKSEEQEQLLRLDELGDLVNLASPARRRCAAVIILATPNAVGHEAKSISKTDAVTHILSDNLRRAPGGVDANGQATFAAVARFLSNTATISLSVGPTPNTLHPDIIIDVVKRLTIDREGNSPLGNAGVSNLLFE